MAIDNKYRRYAKDVLSALIDNPTHTGTAAGAYLPYVRYEMPYMEDTLPAPHGSYADLARGKITLEQFHKGSEIHEMAYAVRDAIAASLRPSSVYTVEAAVARDHKGFGHNVQFFIYSDTHPSPDALRNDLQRSRDAIFAVFEKTIAGDTAEGSQKPAVNFTKLKSIIHDLVIQSMQCDHLDMDHKKSEEPKIVVDHFLFTAEAVLFSQVEQYLDSRNDQERETAKNMMLENYRHAEKLSREFSLRTEFRNKSRLDAAVNVVHDYLQSINGTPYDHSITYMTAKRKVLSGQRLMEYFLDDIKIEAYEHIFNELGIDFPKQSPGRRAG